MGNWKIFKKESKKDRTDHSDQIVNTFGMLVEDFYAQRRPIRTRAVKLSLINLGHQLGYKVYANGLQPEDIQKVDQPFVNKEWLFDLHWYTDDNDPYTVKSLPLVVECEWNPKRKGDSRIFYSGVKYDFQKLLVSNAALRLMIFTIENTDTLGTLKSYFQKSIETYEHLNINARFLFIAFDNRSKCFYYKRIKKHR